MSTIRHTCSRPGMMSRRLAICLTKGKGLREGICYNTDRLCISFVDLNFAQDDAEKSAPAVLNAPRFDVNVSAVKRTDALDVESRSKEGVVEARDEAAHLVLLVDRLRSALVVDIDGHFIQVLRVVAVCRPSVVYIIHQNHEKQH